MTSSQTRQTSWMLGTRKFSVIIMAAKTVKNRELLDKAYATKAVSFPEEIAIVGNTAPTLDTLKREFVKVCFFFHATCAGNLWF